MLRKTRIEWAPTFERPFCVMKRQFWHLKMHYLVLAKTMSVLSDLRRNETDNLNPFGLDLYRDARERKIVEFDCQHDYRVGEVRPESRVQWKRDSDAATSARTHVRNHACASPIASQDHH